MKKLWRFLTGLFNKTKVFVEKYAKPSVQLVENLKVVINSPVADVITAIIPGNLDDITKEAMRKALPIVLQDLKIAQDCIGDTPEVIAQKALAAMAAYSKGDKQKAYTDIAAKLADYISNDHKLDWGEISSLIVYTYKEFFVKAA